MSSIVLFDFCEIFSVARMRKSVFLSEDLPSSVSVTGLFSSLDWAKWIKSIHLNFSSSQLASKIKDPPAKYFISIFKKHRIQNTRGDTFPAVRLFNVFNLQSIEPNYSLSDIIDVLLNHWAPHQRVVEQEEVSPFTSLSISLNKESLGKELSGSIV